MSRTKSPIFDALPLLADCKGIVLGVSGGPDSMAMLGMFLEARDEGFPFPFVCATLDHALRKESAEEAQAVGRFCREHGVDFETERADFSSFSGDSLENAARERRYAFFERVKQKYGYSHIATAHNADDNLESVLLNLIRGCGTDGLRGISAHRKDNNTVRPLLGLTKAELTAYCEEKNLPYFLDSSNTDTRYRRNFLRHRVVPLLKELNPSVTEAAARLTASASEDRDFLEEQSRLALEQVRTDGGLSRERLKGLPPALLSRVLRLYAEEITGESPDFGETEAFKVLALTGKTSDKIRFCGKDFRLTYKTLTTEEPKAESFAPFVPKLGENPLPEGVLLIEEDETYQGEPHCFRRLPLSEMLVRPRREGDYMHTPQGCGKLVKKLYTDKKIPASLRPSLPLLTAGEDIVWAAEIGTDPAFRPQKGESYYSVTYFSHK